MPVTFLPAKFAPVYLKFRLPLQVHVFHQKNGGVTKARLTGVAQARGEWIGFVDGDDFIEPDMYERLLNNALKFDADISHCGYQMVFPSRVDYYYNTGKLVLQDQEAGLKDLLDGVFIEPGLCNKLFQKTIIHSLLNSNVMDTTIKNFEDLLMNYYLFRSAKKSVYEDFCGYHYMIRPGSAATSIVNEHKLNDPLTVLRIIKEDTAGKHKLQQIINCRIAGCLIGLATMSLRNEKTIVAPYRRKARKDLRRMLPELWRGTYSQRLKIMSTWAAVFPSSYQGAHYIYSALRGTRRKYEVK